MLQTFNFKNHQVRTSGTADRPLFCLIDVCEVLGIDSHRNVVSRLDSDGVHTIDSIDSLGRSQPTTFIDEPNLYRTIFQSRKPNAQEFQSWVFADVLPTIRKTGSYHVQSPQPLHPPTQLKTVPEMFVMAGEALMLHQGQIQELQIKMQKIEDNQERCIEEMAAMPEASVATPILATRRAILKAVNLYSMAKGVEQRTAWNLLYEELRLRCGVAVKLRAKVSPQETYLDVAVRLGYGDQLYAIALDLFGLAKEVV